MTFGYVCLIDFFVRPRPVRLESSHSSTTIYTSHGDLMVVIGLLRPKKKTKNNKYTSFGFFFSISLYVQCERTFPLEITKTVTMFVHC